MSTTASVFSLLIHWKEVCFIMRLKKLRMLLIVSTLSVFFSGCGQAGQTSSITPEMSPTAEAPANTPDNTPKVEFLKHYMPQTKTDFDHYKESGDVKSIYVSSSYAATKSLFEERLAICDNTEVNSIVIDIKETDGIVLFEGIDIADRMGISRDYIPDIRGLIKRLKEKNIYVIGRMVTFKDDFAAEKFPQLGIILEDGTIFSERSDAIKWLNPYNKNTWSYEVSIAKGAAMLGFDEIQFDYFRFPTSSKINNARFGDTGGLSKTEIITEFAKYAVSQLKPYGVKVSVDVYGTIVLSSTDADIVGQDYISLCKIFDYVSPMPYPSHFNEGSLGIDYPDLYPYDTIYKFLVKSNEKLAGVEGIKAEIRPWLQDFTAPWIAHYQKYEAQQVREQIQACYDAGISSWMLWGSGGWNSEGALLPETN